MLATIGVVFYAGVAIVAAVAAVTAPRLPDARGWQSPRGHWLAIAAVIALLALWRALDGEAAIQAVARAAAHSAALYERRREFQLPVIVVGALAGAAAIGAVARAPAPSPEMRWSRILALTLAFYTIVRTLSYHGVDAVIYAGVGRWHVNHLIDMGLAAAIAVCAGFAVRRHTAIARSQRANRR